MSYTVKENHGLTTAQYELVNMLSCLRDEADVAALKTLLVGFLNTRIQGELDRLYDAGTLSDEKFEALSRQHLRTPYAAAI